MAPLPRPSPQRLDVSNVTALLGHNVGELQKARSHPTVRSWLYSLNSSALGQLGLDASPAGPSSPASPSSPAGPAHGTSGPPSTTHQAPHLVHTSGLPGNAAQASTSGMAPTPLRLGPLCPEPSQTCSPPRGHSHSLSTSFVHCFLG